MKKILFINGHLNTGGVEKSLIDILNHIDLEKYDVDLLLLEEIGDYAPLVPVDVHINLKCLKSTYGSFFKSIFYCIKHKDFLCLRMRLIFLLQKFFGIGALCLAKKILTNNKKYDCVIGFRKGICSQIAAYAVNTTKRITWWHHGFFNTDAKSYYNEVKKFSKIVAVSNACKNFLIENVPEIKSSLITIPNMVDIIEVKRNANAFNPYHTSNLLHIVSVGGLSLRKHFENAIYAAHKLKEKGFVFKWHLVGDGDMKQELEQNILQYDVEDCFIMEGNQPNPYPFIKNANLFVHPSYVESQGIVILEAMALGIPCVVTKSLGACEFIRDGFNGILTEQNRSSLASKVIEILQNKSLYTQLKSNTKCPQDFMPNNVMKMINDILN